ncbi:MAG: class I SAM-dependent methyltransferase [Bacteroidota bacterium]
MDKNKIAVAVFNKMAQVYQDKFMDVNLYDDTFDFFCKAITSKNAEVLELACGPGNITQHLLKKRPDFRILGTDLAPNMIALARINNPGIPFEVMDCREIDKIDRTFNGIMCGFCLPYLAKKETIKLINDAFMLLKPGGVLYLSTMEDDYTKSEFKKGSGGDEIFMHFYRADDLISISEERGFKILNLDRKEYPAADGTVVVDLVLIAGKQDEHL